MTVARLGQDWPPDIGLGQPVTGQYSGHVISLVQSEARVTSDTVVSTSPAPVSEWCHSLAQTTELLRILKETISTL